jgi:hypothetical protein
VSGEIIAKKLTGRIYREVEAKNKEQRGKRKEERKKGVSHLFSDYDRAGEP